jgi:hypothetical protein
VTRQAHFFELGGHSLLAVGLVTKLRQALGIEVALRVIFDHPTLSELARWLAGQGAGHAADDGTGPGAGRSADPGVAGLPTTASLSARTSRLATLLDDLETED